MFVYVISEFIGGNRCEKGDKTKKSGLYAQKDPIFYTKK